MKPAAGRVRARFAVVALGIAQLVGCRAREGAFYEAIFPCDVKDGDAACGTTRAGKRMTCFAATQLGGTDFCAEACDPAQPTEVSGFTCLTSGALLQLCKPNASAGNPSLGCPPGLACYRTDLLADVGVCIDMQVCSQDSDCTDPKHPTCAATIVRELQSTIPIMADHLQCVQRMCASGGSGCLPGESCLMDFYPNGTDLRDLCVPNCVADHQCPPNYGCAVTPASLGSAPVCLPGIPGVRCINDQDCVLGACLDTGAGFSECVPPFPCTSDAQCAFLDHPAATFVCVEGVPGQGQHCVLRQSFAGANCTVSTDCPEGQQCFHYSPAMVDQGMGECRVPCDADLRCPVRGGIPHVCLDDGGGGCYPTGFGLPCASAADCPTELSCQAVSPDERTVVRSPTICTTPCTEDGDCANNILVGGGFCKEGFCRMAGETGVACDRDAECATHVCAFDPLGNGRCAN